MPLKFGSFSLYCIFGSVDGTIAVDQNADPWMRNYRWHVSQIWNKEKTKAAEAGVLCTA